MSDECVTVNCREPATVTLRIESDYESITGETRTTVHETEYCDEHAEMWLGLDGVARTRYERIENDE